MSNVTFLWIFSRGMELGVIVLCLLPLRLLLRRMVPRLFSYLLWIALPVNVGYNLCEFIWSSFSKNIVDHIHKASQVVVTEKTVQIMKSFWVGGSLLVIFGMTYSYIIFMRRLIGSIRLQDGIYLADRIRSPFTLGILRPKIYLPLSLKEEYHEPVILHERVHIARRDVWMKYLAIGILGLFWFQPILWFAYRLFINDMEEACDEAVLRKKGLNFKEEYARSLVEVSFQASKVRGAAIGYGNGEIKARIWNVMNYKQVGKRKCAVALVLCCLFAVVAIPISWQVPRVVKTESKEARLQDVMSVKKTGIDKKSMRENE